MRMWLIAGLLASTMAGAAMAQEAPPPGPPPMAGEAPPPPGAGGGMGMALFRMADRNHDGVVTREEYLAAVDARFDREDLNHDGVLQAGERPIPRQGGAAMRMRRDGPPPGMQSGMAQVPAPGADGPPPPMRDITRAEYRAAALRRFDRLDANHDGKVDQNEMQSAAMMMQFRGGGGGKRQRPMDGGDTPPPPPPPPGAQ